MLDSGTRERARVAGRGWKAAAALLACAATAGASAGQAASSFAVTVQLGQTVSIAPCEVKPGPSTRSATLPITCDAAPIGKPPAPAGFVDGRSFRFMLPNGYGLGYGAFDLNAGTGSITSWRIVRLADWDYLEMTVGW